MLTRCLYMLARRPWILARSRGARTNACSVHTRVNASLAATLRLPTPPATPAPEPRP